MPIRGCGWLSLGGWKDESTELLPMRETAVRGNIILDPFAGSGTTGRACKDLGRKCIMVEIEEKYVKIAANRLRQEVLF